MAGETEAGERESVVGLLGVEEDGDRSGAWFRGFFERVGGDRCGVTDAII